MPTKRTRQPVGDLSTSTWWRCKLHHGWCEYNQRSMALYGNPCLSATFLSDLRNLLPFGSYNLPRQDALLVPKCTLVRLSSCMSWKFNVLLHRRPWQSSQHTVKQAPVHQPAIPKQGYSLFHNKLRLSGNMLVLDTLYLCFGCAQWFMLK